MRTYLYEIGTRVRITTELRLLHLAWCPPRLAGREGVVSGHLRKPADDREYQVVVDGCPNDYGGWRIYERCLHPTGPPETGYL